ncbi:MAG: hypothetical protein OEY11_12220 [Gammaproteobacteria bacterium]|nr:hypothetical protein [Gammaproteobacteria bacterium]
MIHYCYLIVNLTNQEMEMLGVSGVEADFLPGVSVSVPVAVPGPDAVPPPPPVVRLVKYFNFEYDGEITADQLFNNHTYVNPNNISFNMPGITKLTFSPVEENYGDYMVRVGA